MNHPFCLLLPLALLLPAAAAPDTAGSSAAGDAAKTQLIRFREDDAQNDMASRIYSLKHLKANDLVPFLLGAVKRYARNSSVDRINYSAGREQLVAVTCPAPMMPYVDAIVATMDRPGPTDANGSRIDGTGMVRYVYEPRYRSSEAMVELMIKAGIPSNATAGPGQDATVAFDAHTNLIYWKDSQNKDKDLRKYLAWLDRPVPQAALTLEVYEVRDSTLRDLGIDYLAWKNGPGLDLFGAGWNFMNLHFNELIMDAVLSHAPDLAGAVSGAYGGLFVAPAFDASFLRILQQNGKATIGAEATITVGSAPDASFPVRFSPEYPNAVKGDNDRTSIVAGAPADLELTVSAPVLCPAAPPPVDGGAAAVGGNLNFRYRMITRNAVERNNYGRELSQLGLTSSTVTIALGREQTIAAWEQEYEVEQTVGIPFLCELPVLKYLFGTTTVNREKSFYFLTARAVPLRPDTDLARLAGSLTAVETLVNRPSEENAR